MFTHITMYLEDIKKVTYKTRIKIVVFCILIFWILALNIYNEQVKIEEGKKPVNNLSTNVRNTEIKPICFPFNANLSSVDFSPEGKTFLVAHKYIISLFDTSSGKHIRDLKSNQSYVNSAVFSPDGKTILTGLDDKTAILWDTITGSPISAFEGHTDEVNSVAFSPDGKKIVTGSSDHTAKLWITKTGQLIKTFQHHSGGIKCVAFSPDGEWIITGSGISENSAILCDTATGNILLTFKGDSGPINFVAFSPDGSKALMASGGSLIFLDLSTKSIIKKIEDMAEAVCSGSFSPDGRWILTGQMEPHGAKLWDAKTIEEVYTLKSGPHGVEGTVTSVAFSPDGSKILTGHFWGAVKLWDRISGKLILWIKNK